jgi:hypothetical protein
LALTKIETLEELRGLERAERFAASSELSPQYALFNETEEEHLSETDIGDPVSEDISVPAIRAR